MRHLPLVLATALLLAGCPAQKPTTPTPSAGGYVAPPSAAVGTVVTGDVLAPANLIGNDGSTLVGNDGASVITNGTIRLVGNDGGSMVAAGGGNAVPTNAGNMVAAGGGNYRLAQAAPRRIAGCPVFLADAGGNPIPGLAAVETDASGRYTFRGVPAGYAFQVVARARLADGRDARLTTLVRTTDLGATAPVGAETTIATAAVLGGLQGPLGAYGEATYARIVEVSKRARPADWTKLEAVAQAVAQLQAEAAELKTLVGTMRDEIAKLQQSLDGLKADIAATAQATPAPTPIPTPTPTSSAFPGAEPGETPAGDPAASPTPAATASPAASTTPGAPETVYYRMPEELRGGLVFKSALPEPGAWSFFSMLPAAVDGDLRALAWRQTSEAPATYVDLPGSGGGRVSGRDGLMTVEPGDLRPTVIAWRPPAAGRLTWQLSAASAATADGVRVAVGRYDLATGQITALQEGMVLAQVPYVRGGVLAAVAAGEVLVVSFDKAFTPAGDACTVSLGLGFTPAATAPAAVP